MNDASPGKAAPTEPMSPEDREALAELDSLYRKTAAADGADVDFTSGDPEALKTCYTILQADPEASLVEIKVAYERLKASWDPSRFPQIADWAEKSAAKNCQLDKAYECILKDHLNPPPGGRLSDTLKTTPEPAAKEAIPRVAPATTGEIPLSEALPPEPGETDPPARISLLLPSWRLLILVMLVLATAVGGLFFWPTLYQYDIVQVGSAIYPMRTNRITGVPTYFDGEAWVTPPFPSDTAAAVGAAKPAPTADPSKAGTAPPPAATVEKPVPPAETAPTAPKTAAPSAVERQDMPKASAPGAPAEPAPQKPKTAAVQRENLKRSSASGAFTIQVKALRSESAAQDLAKALRIDGTTGRVVGVSLPGKGKMYRVVVGSFTTRSDAMEFLKKKKIVEKHPGSFVQRNDEGRKR